MSHLQAIRRVIKYLKKTMNYGLTYSGYPSVLEGYSNASWTTNKEDHSWLGVPPWGRSNFWSSKKQTCITDSTMASKFIALASGGKEAEWLRNLMFVISFLSKSILPITIHCDNTATLAKAYSEIYNGKSRHVGLRHSYVQGLIKDGVITFDYVRTKFNLVDCFT